jgi:hypothetical protein
MVKKDPEEQCSSWIERKSTRCAVMKDLRDNQIGIALQSALQFS